MGWQQISRPIVRGNYAVEQRPPNRTQSAAESAPAADERPPVMHTREGSPNLAPRKVRLQGCPTRRCNAFARHAERAKTSLREPDSALKRARRTKNSHQCDAARYEFAAGCFRFAPLAKAVSNPSSSMRRCRENSRRPSRLSHLATWGKRLRVVSPRIRGASTARLKLRLLRVRIWQIARSHGRTRGGRSR
jgi:hypothetical protein